MDGINPFNLAANVIPAVQKGDNKQVQNFKFKQQVLAILLDHGSQTLLRSILHVFKRVRMHQKAYTEEAKSPEECLRSNIL